MINRRKALQQLILLLEELEKRQRKERELTIPLKDGGQIIIELSVKDEGKKQLKLCDKTGSEG